MNIPLKPDLQKFIDDQVRQGRYDSPEDAINAAVARLQTDRDLSGLSLGTLRGEIPSPSVGIHLLASLHLNTKMPGQSPRFRGDLLRVP